MATGSIDLQCGPQIKPQDKRPGRRTMEEHSGPHGKLMTTGRSGRPQPTTGALVPGRKRPHNTRQERLAAYTTRQPTAVVRGTTPSRRKISAGTQITILPFYFQFFSSPLFLNLFFSILSVSPSLSRPSSLATNLEESKYVREVKQSVNL